MLSFAKTIGVLDKEQEPYKQHLIFCNAKGYPIADCEVNGNGTINIQEVLSSIRRQPVTSFFTITLAPNGLHSEEEIKNYYAENDQMFSEMYDMLKRLGLKHLDSFYQYDETLPFQNNEGYVYSEKFSVNDEVLRDYTETKNYYKCVLEYDDLLDFLEYNTVEEIKTCNLEKDSGRIAELLRCGFMHNYYETATYILFDKEKNVKDVLSSKGNITSSIVSMPYLNEKLAEKEVSGLWFNHNHPSGIIAPSKEDMVVTESVSKLCDIYYKNMFASSIVGKEGIYYIEKDWQYDYDKERMVERSQQKEPEKEGEPKKEEVKVQATKERKEFGLPPVHSVVASMTDTEKVL